MKKKFISVILCIVLSLSLAACNTQPGMGSGNQVIATSGDYELLLRDYLYFLSYLRIQNEDWLMQLGISDIDIAEYWNDSFDEDSERTVFDDLKDGAMLQAQTSFALFLHASALGYSYDAEVVARLTTDIQGAVAGMNSPERTGERAFYEFYYLTPDEIIETFKMLTTTDVFQQSLYDSMVVTDADILAFYNNEDNAAIIDSLSGALVAHILISFDSEAEDEEADRAETLERAENILERILAGESFAALVSEYSQDPGSVDNEGQYYISSGAPFVPEFMEWTFSAEVGDFGIVETEHGLHIMNLVHRDTFEDMLETRYLPVESQPGQPPATLPSLEDVIRNQMFLAEMDSVLASIEREWTVNEALFDSIQFDVYARTR